jgi:SAM-dependent methyltransferase
VLSLDPSASPSTPVPAPNSPYWLFYDEVASAQLAAWVPEDRVRVLDLSLDGPARAALLRDLGHDVVRVGAGPVPGVHTVLADTRVLDWVRDDSFDAVVAESRALSLCLATEETARDLVRVLRPGGRMLLCVDSMTTGLARLADQGRWAELADMPSADVVLVEDDDGTLSRSFWPDELKALLEDAGFDVEWVRPRSVLTPVAVERALAAGGNDAVMALVRSELQLAVDTAGETPGIHLVCSARKPG